MFIYLVDHLAANLKNKTKTNEQRETKQNHCI